MQSNAFERSVKIAPACCIIIGIISNFHVIYKAYIVNILKGGGPKMDSIDTRSYVSPRIKFMVNFSEF